MEGKVGVCYLDEWGLIGFEKLEGKEIDYVKGKGKKESQ